MGICSPFRCAVTQHKYSSELFKAKCNPHCSVLLCKTASQQADFHCTTPWEICSSYRRPVTQHNCTATLFKATCNPHCSVLLCKTASQQAVFHCNCTYGTLLFIQVCSDPAQIQQSFLHWNSSSQATSSLFHWDADQTNCFIWLTLRPSHTNQHATAIGVCYVPLET